MSQKNEIEAKKPSLKTDFLPSDGASCSRRVLQRRYLSTDMPAPWREWHDHPEPHQIAWSKGQFDTLEENMKNACANYHEMSPMVEFRMVCRTDEVEWEFSSAN